MNLYFSLAAILTLYLVGVHGQGTFLPAQRVNSAETDPARLLGVGGRSSFKKILQKDSVTKWMQTVQDIPIYGSVLTTHNNELGQIQERQGFVSLTAALVDTRPAITGEEAVDMLRTQWNHSPTASDLVYRVDTAELQILKGERGIDKLVWKVGYLVERKNFVAAQSGSGKVPAYIKGLVNAHTNVIERSWDNLQFAKIRAIVGNQKIGKSFHDIDVEKISQSSCKHRDAARRIEVFDNLDRTEISRQTTSRFQCNEAAEDSWDSFSRTGAYSPRNEVFLHATQFVDMWKELMGDAVKPYKTSSSFLRFYTHYDQRLENAFFDGDSFKFGDGKNTFYPLTSLDIVCHEIGHSVTQWHGGDMEYREESGAMNEAYSDILGATCDMNYKDRTGGLIGTDIMRPGNPLGTSLRNMCDPPSIGRSIDHMSKYRSHMDVHSTSGIYNKAWCTLMNTSGWDYKQVFEVFTDANLLYWSPTVTMHCGACGVESAAADRGYRRDDVTAAFRAVGVSCRSCN